MDIEDKRFTSSFKDRLKEALASRNMSQSKLANSIGVSTVSVTKYMNGASEPRTLQLKKISDTLDVDEGWLLGMDVPMERSMQMHEALSLVPGDMKGPSKEKLSQTEQGLVDIFRSLDFQGQLKVLNLANDLKSNSEEIK